jgi:hypothetical protein
MKSHRPWISNASHLAPFDSSGRALQCRPAPSYISERVLLSAAGHTLSPAHICMKIPSPPLAFVIQLCRMGSCVCTGYLALRRVARKYFTFIAPLACVTYLPVVDMLDIPHTLGSCYWLQLVSLVSGVLFLPLALRCSGIQVYAIAHRPAVKFVQIEIRKP